jgi:hypothetical protein
MYLPATLTASATVPFFAIYLAETKKMRETDGLITVAYICAVGLLIIAADAHGLSAWFALASNYTCLF